MKPIIFILFIILIILFSVIFTKKKMLFTNLNKTKRRMYLKPNWGFINRTRSIVSAKILCDRLNWDLYIIWDIGDGHMRWNYNNIFGNNNHLWKVETDFDKNVKNKINNNDLFETSFQIRTIDKKKFVKKNIMQNIIDTKKKIILIDCGYNFFDPQMNFKDYCNEKSKIYRSIKFNKKCFKYIQQLPKHTLGIHLRFEQLNENIKQNMESELLSKIEKINKTKIIKNIYISGDDIEKIKKYYNFLNEKKKFKVILTNSIKNSDDRETTEACYHAIANWLTLCKCNYLLLTKISSYSEESFIYNPKRLAYYLGEKEPINIG